MKRNRGREKINKIKREKKEKKLREGESEEGKRKRLRLRKNCTGKNKEQGKIETRKGKQQDRRMEDLEVRKVMKMYSGRTRGRQN